jgi:hypothetical protein
VSASSAIAALKLSRTPTSLATYLSLYNKAPRECHLNYMEGAIALAHWLQPIEVPLPFSAVPRLLRTYELWQLAKALAPYTTTNPIHTNQIEDAIYEILR